MKRISTILLTGFILISIFSGCKNVNVINTNAKTKEIVDSIGRKVTIPKEPKRVACLYASTAHIMALLEEEDKIYGAPDGVRRDILMQYKRPNIVDIAVPFMEGIINIEELSRINADLALVRKSTAENEAEVEKLNNLKIPYVVIDYDNLESLKKAILVSGEVFDKQEKAKEYVKYFDETLNMVNSRMSGAKNSEKKRVFHAVNEASRTDRKGDICSEIIALSGLYNVSIDGNLTNTGEKSYTTLEQIYSFNPEYIIANDYNTTNYILTDSKWAGLKAVKNKRVYTLPVGVTRWVHPGSIEAHMGALFLARQFYPDRFSDIDLVEVTKDYYKKFFDLNLDNETVVKILSGEGMRLNKDKK